MGASRAIASAVCHLLAHCWRVDQLRLRGFATIGHQKRSVAMKRRARIIFAAAAAVLIATMVLPPIKNLADNPPE
jgi:hypothetical protein